MNRVWGAYVLHLTLQRRATVRVGSLDSISFPAGHYLYVGSARRGIDARIARHRRLSDQKSGKLHWHIDYLLTHPHIKLTDQTVFAFSDECAVSKQIAELKGVSVPAPRFGSSDCRFGCRAHLYRLDIKRGFPHIELALCTQCQKQDNSKENKNG
jgi:Uri superfamily endonuclease